MRGTTHGRGGGRSPVAAAACPHGRGKRALIGGICWSLLLKGEQDFGKQVLSGEREEGSGATGQERE